MSQHDFARNHGYASEDLIGRAANKSNRSSGRQSTPKPRIQVEIGQDLAAGRLIRYQLRNVAQRRRNAENRPAAITRRHLAGGDSTLVPWSVCVRTCRTFICDIGLCVGCGDSDPDAVFRIRLAEGEDITKHMMVVITRCERVNHYTGVPSTRSLMVWLQSPAERYRPGDRLPPGSIKDIATSIVGLVPASFCTI